MLTSKLLKVNPKNAYLKGKMITETKNYNRLIKSKQKHFVDSMFDQLDAINKSDPKGYKDLVKSLRDGNFDTEIPDDTSRISPQEWFAHFSELLSKNISSQENSDHKKTC